ncbi:MAG: NAD(P)-dependent glycerol-3-phosphate dehydrogenase [Bacilli bacterium]|nr:NAD(P)-dependent glycerol-3-phosphate dehydrogenase [Bacilli bacterium]
MKIGILGTGAYGLALSSIMHDNGCDITMYTRTEEEKNVLETERVNKRRLPDYKIPDDIKITTSLEECLNDKDLIVCAIPAEFIDELAQNITPYIKPTDKILIATKGIEQDTGLLIHQIFSKYVKTKNIAVISGPSFATDLITKMPAGLSLASKNRYTASVVRKALANKYIKLRNSKDLVGTEVCGAIKNVIALASGMLEGLGANESTKAMLLTEATHDMMEILQAFRARRVTVTSFAGLGDLILTCTSTKSRNYSFGKLLGQKASKKEIDKYLEETTVEGYYTLVSIYKLLKDKRVEIPIIDLIYDIAVEGDNPEKLLTFLVEKD